MSSLFHTIFGCCLGRRSHTTQDDERRPLVQPVDVHIEPPPIIVQDEDELREQLFAAHRDAASRMVNVEATHPFIVLPTHDSSYSHSDSRSQSRSSSRHFDSESRSMSPDRREGGLDATDSQDVFHVGISGVRFLRPDVMRGRSGSMNRGRPRIDLRNGNARLSRENIIPMLGEGFSSSYYDTQIPTPTQLVQNPPHAPKGKSVVREFPPVHQVMGVGENDYYD